MAFNPSRHSQHSSQTHPRLRLPVAVLQLAKPADHKAAVRTVLGGSGSGSLIATCCPHCGCIVARQHSMPMRLQCDAPCWAACTWGNRPQLKAPKNASLPPLLHSLREEGSDLLVLHRKVYVIHNQRLAAAICYRALPAAAVAAAALSGGGAPRAAAAAGNVPAELNGQSLLRVELRHLHGQAQQAQRAQQRGGWCAWVWGQQRQQQATLGLTSSRVQQHATAAWPPCNSAAHARGTQRSTPHSIQLLENTPAGSAPLPWPAPPPGHPRTAQMQTRRPAACGTQPPRQTCRGCNIVHDRVSSSRITMQDVPRGTHPPFQTCGVHKTGGAALAPDQRQYHTPPRHSRQPPPLTQPSTPTHCMKNWPISRALR